MHAGPWPLHIALILPPIKVSVKLFGVLGYPIKFGVKCSSCVGVWWESFFWVFADTFGPLRSSILWFSHIHLAAHSPKPPHIHRILKITNSLLNSFPRVTTLRKCHKNILRVHSVLFFTTRVINTIPLFHACFLILWITRIYHQTFSVPPLQRFMICVHLPLLIVKQDIFLVLVRVLAALSISFNYIQTTIIKIKTKNKINTFPFAIPFFCGNILRKGNNVTPGNNRQAQKRVSIS